LSGRRLRYPDNQAEIKMQSERRHHGSAIIDLHQAAVRPSGVPGFYWIEIANLQLFPTTLISRLISKQNHVTASVPDSS